jgi:hypothetical protein
MLRIVIFMKNLFTGIFMMVLMGGTLPVQADDGDIDLGYLQLHDDSVYVTEALTGWWRDAKETFDVRMSWYKEAKFGGFIHWGAYSPFGGSFQGNPPDGGYAEHLMRMHRIPVATYNEEVVKTFNPTRFNATEWVAKIK